METISQPRMLMCAPDYFGIEYEINPWMNVRVKSDSKRASDQWSALYQVQGELGVAIDLIEPVRGLPDLVFTANAGLVYHRLFVVSQFRYGVRQGEAPYFANWAKSRGLEVVELPPGYHFEGAGDALFCGETLFAGYRFRSDVRSHQWIGERLGIEVLPMELVDPRFYHLDTCFCPLAPDLAMYYPGAFDEYGRSVIRDRVPRLIEVAAEEAISFSCNAVVVGKTVILNEVRPSWLRTWRSTALRRGCLAFPSSSSRAEVPSASRSASTAKKRRAGNKPRGATKRESPEQRHERTLHRAAWDRGRRTGPRHARCRAAADAQRRKAHAADRPWSARLELDLDRIVTSPMVRARADGGDPGEGARRGRPARSLERAASRCVGRTVARWLRGRSKERLMIVGHNPAVSELISVLVLGASQPSICDLKKGAIAALAPPASPDDLYRLHWVAPPRLLRRIEGGDEE